MQISEKVIKEKRKCKRQQERAGNGPFSFPSQAASQFVKRSLVAYVSVQRDN